VPLAGTVSSDRYLGTMEELRMLLLSRIILCCDIHKGCAQYSWDTHIVINSKGDVEGLAPKGHTKTYLTHNGEPAPIDIVEH